MGILIASFLFLQYVKSNRLLITDSYLQFPVAVKENGKDSVLMDKKLLQEDTVTTKIQFKDIADWSMNPFGLVVETKENEKSFFPMYWDEKSVEAVLEDR